MEYPRYVLLNNFNEVANAYLNREITSNEAAQKLNMARSTFLRYVK
ncbi:MAG: hypothetical protein WC260_03980 [Candidatus Pacearchaeota archaeon]